MNSTAKRSLWALSVVLVAVLGCNPLASALGGGNAGTVGDLWPDVPPFEGATKIDVELPLSVRLAIDAITRAVSAQGEAQGEGRLEEVDFIAYSTPATAQEVEAFYSADRMADAGWTTEGEEFGCTGAGIGDADAGTFCFFAKEEGEETTALFIVAVPVAEGETQIYYLRGQVVLFNNP